MTGDKQAAVTAGIAAQAAGVPWYINPHESGGALAYMWDGGHTIARHALVENAKRRGFKPSEFVTLVSRVHGAPISCDFARRLLKEAAA